MNYGYSQSPPKERLRLKITNEERGYFSSLVEIADKDFTGKLEGKTAANFLKKSGLSKEILKQIWLIAAQTDPTFLERDEFYIALRLVALAQNNMEYTEESIRLNHPLPPFPKFDLKSEQQQSMSDMSLSAISKQQAVTMNNSNTSINVVTESNVGSQYMIGHDESIESFVISYNDEEKYNKVFEMNKDNDGCINPFKATQLWFNSNASNEVIHKIMGMVPFKSNDSMNNKEFNVCTHLVIKSFKCELPSVLPTVLKEYLGVVIEDNKKSLDHNSPNTQMNYNISSNIPSTAKVIPNASIDMESVLLKEFNMKPIVKTEKKSSMKNYKGVGTVGTVAGVKNLLEQLKEMEKEALSENEFLTKELDDSLAMLHSFTDDIEKVNKTVNDLNRKSQMIKDEITDYRRRINIEKDTMVKLSINMKMLKDELEAA